MAIFLSKISINATKHKVISYVDGGEETNGAVIIPRGQEKTQCSYKVCCEIHDYILTFTSCFSSNCYSSGSSDYCSSIQFSTRHVLSRLKIFLKMLIKVLRKYIPFHSHTIVIQC